MKEAVIIGIISSIIASVVFYIIMIVIKPRFAISDKICCKQASPNTDYYIIKVVNSTRALLTNIDYSLVYCKENEDDTTDISTLNPLKPPLKIMYKYTKKNTDYAVRITYEVDREKYPVDENKYFVFTFQANHSFSNAVKIKEKTYKNYSIRQGIFETGKSTKIINNN